MDRSEAPKEILCWEPFVWETSWKKGWKLLVSYVLNGTWGADSVYSLHLHSAISADDRDCLSWPEKVSVTTLTP
jgi:hypothetical protein